MTQTSPQRAAVLRDLYARAQRFTAADQEARELRDVVERLERRLDERNSRLEQLYTRLSQIRRGRETWRQRALAQAEENRKLRGELAYERSKWKRANERAA